MFETLFSNFPRDPAFYAVGAFATLLMGVSKVGFGGASGGVGVMMLAQVMPPAMAAAVMLPLLCLMDLFGIKAFWRHIDWTLFRRIIPGGLIGTLLGAFAFNLLSVSALKVLIGAIGVALPLVQWLKFLPTTRPVRSPLREKATAGFWSTFSGYTSFVAHAGGPPILAYVIPLQLSKSTHVALMSVFFMTLNYSKIPFYNGVNILTQSVLFHALALLPIVPLGAALGLWVHQRLTREQFFSAINWLTFIMASKLLFDGLREILK